MRSPDTVPRRILFAVFLLLLTAIVFCGCLSASSEQNMVRVEILEKTMTSADLGECSYETLMKVINNGTSDIHSLSLRVELFDPETQKVAAWESVPIGDLRAGETMNATSHLQTHCRLNYTLRTYAQY